MKSLIRTLAICAVLVAAALPGLATEPDYAAWTGLLQKYYSPQNGMDYQGLRKTRPACNNARRVASVYSSRRLLVRVACCIPLEHRLTGNIRIVS